MRKLKTAELNRISIEEFKEQVKTPLCVVLDNVRSMHNIGAIFRTADAFKIEKIYLCGITAKPPHRDIQKTALGATESVEWIYKKNSLDALAELKKKNYYTLAIEQADSSTKLQNYPIDPNKKYALIFGNEVKGVQQNLIDQCDGCIEIPQEGIKHSLNISVCAGILLWDFYKKLR